MRRRTFITSQNLDARMSALFVQNASKFHSKIKISSGDKVMNGKSMMGIISMAIYEGEEITITAEGNDEAEAIEVLSQMLS